MKLISRTGQWETKEVEPLCKTREEREAELAKTVEDKKTKKTAVKKKG